MDQLLRTGCLGCEFFPTFNEVWTVDEDVLDGVVGVAS